MAIISLTSSGVKDFFVQRVTAVILTVYFAYILVKSVLLAHAGALNYNSWHAIFTDNIFFRVATLMAYLSMFLHAWVGLWTICGDYIKNAWASLIIMIVFIVSYVFCFFWLFVVLFFY